MVYNIGSSEDTVMTDKLESPIQDRKAYIIYVANKGFMKNRHGQFVEDFTLARIFGSEKGATYAQNDSKVLKQLEKQGFKSYVIDVNMELDPRHIFKRILVGK